MNSQGSFPLDSFNDLSRNSTASNDVESRVSQDRLRRSTGSHTRIADLMNENDSGGTSSSTFVQGKNSSSSWIPSLSRENTSVWDTTIKNGPSSDRSSEPAVLGIKVNPSWQPVSYSSVIEQTQFFPRTGLETNYFGSSSLVLNMSQKNLPNSNIPQTGPSVPVFQGIRDVPNPSSGPSPNLPTSPSETKDATGGNSVYRSVFPPSNYTFPAQTLSTEVPKYGLETNIDEKTRFAESSVYHGFSKNSIPSTNPPQRATSANIRTSNELINPILHQTAQPVYVGPSQPREAIDPDILNSTGTIEADKYYKQKHALDFLYKVKLHYSRTPAVYNEFLEIMKEFKELTISTWEVIDRVRVLFQDRPNLIREFNSFLPSSCKIDEIPPEKPPVAVKQEPQLSKEVPRVETAQPTQEPPKTQDTTTELQQQNDLEHARIFVRKVKQRFSPNQSAVYRRFLEVLHLYYNNSNNIQTVYQEIMELFKGHDDLFAEFKLFLPRGIDNTTQVPKRKQERKKEEPKTEKRTNRKPRKEGKRGKTSESEGDEEEVEDSKEVEEGYTSPKEKKQKLNKEKTRRKKSRGEDEEPGAFEESNDEEEDANSMGEDWDSGKRRGERSSKKPMSRRQILVQQQQQQQTNRSKPPPPRRTAQAKRITPNPSFTQPVAATSVANAKNAKKKKPDEGSNDSELENPQEELSAEEEATAEDMEAARNEAEQILEKAYEKELLFFRIVRERLGKPLYREFLKLVSLFGRDVISKVDTLKLAQTLLHNNADLFEVFKEFIGVIPAPANGKVEPEDLSGPSYSATENAPDTLEKANFLIEQLEKQIEDALKQSAESVVEKEATDHLDRQSELEIMISMNESTMKALQDLSDFSEVTKNPILPQKLDVKYVKNIERLYRARGSEVIRAFFLNPPAVLPVLLRRLRQKNQEFAALKKTLELTTKLRPEIVAK